jgi:hypothetical protein
MNHMEAVLTGLVHVQMSFDTLSFAEAEEKLNALVEDVKRHFNITEERMIEIGIPVCICIDDRGWSTCGVPCPRHPPKYQCPCDRKRCKGCTSGPVEGCAKKVAYGHLCVRCSGGDG